MKKLIFVFVVLFAAVSINQEGYSQKRDNPRSKDFRMDLKSQLNLSEDQEKKIEALRLTKEESMIKLRSDLELKELEIRKLKSSDKFSRSEMINLTKDINSIKNDMALTRVNHQMDVYELLDENQKKIWLDKQDQFGNMKHRIKDKMRERRNW
ncbi:MAG: Spy/CpxP family protein refolding chaperone [Ignavibacterium sp.]|jgi:Spy/CpxP family protein refolding chaperone|nr:Spy/CpxP family protein refolding chaperone [Ignavibacterium sp.]